MPERRRLGGEWRWRNSSAATPAIPALASGPVDPPASRLVPAAQTRKARSRASHGLTIPVLRPAPAKDRVPNHLTTLSLPALIRDPGQAAILNLHERIENKLFLDRTRKDSNFKRPHIYATLFQIEKCCYSTKRDSPGYKVHLTETCDADAPHVIVNVEAATTPDDNMVAVIHKSLETRDLLPAEHLVDKGYTDSRVLVDSRNDYGVTITGPVADDPSWQARSEDGLDKSQFAVD